MPDFGPLEQQVQDAMTGVELMNSDDESTLSDTMSDTAADMDAVGMMANVSLILQNDRQKYTAKKP